MEQQKEGDHQQQQQEQQGLVQVQPQPPPPPVPAAPPSPSPPPKCPRCESRNTKFCYYNNYSFSQPRHFCKTCRRYWTQGGTLRNVPVGGGCRKGKRLKTSLSSSSTSSENSQTPQKLMSQNHLTPAAAFYQGGGSSAGSGGVAVGGAGYLASLAALNQLNNHPSMNYPFDQSLINVGGVGGSGCSNFGLFEGMSSGVFRGSSSSSASQRQNIPQQQIYQLGNGGLELVPMYNNSEQGSINNNPSTMANNNYTTSAASMLQTQSFMNGGAAASNINSMRPLSDASLWSSISTNNYISGANNTASAASQSAASGADADAHAGVRAAGSNSLVLNQWFDLPRFQPPPQ